MGMLPFPLVLGTFKCAQYIQKFSFQKEKAILN